MAPCSLTKFLFISLSLLTAVLCTKIFPEKNCFVCKRQCDKNINSTRSVFTYLQYVESCFGITYGSPDGILCSYCRRAIYEHKATSKTFYHLVDSQIKKVGRPAKRQRPCKISYKETEKTETLFGTVEKGPNGEVTLPPGVFEEMEKNIEILSKRCDLRSELEKVKRRMFEEFVTKKKSPIYDPQEFKKFCNTAGANQLFQEILGAITSEKHSESRNALNQKRVVSLIYKLCYCLSQRCNALQIDQALFFKSSHLNLEGLDTQFNLGNTCCRKTSNAVINNLANNHFESLEAFFSDAIKNEWLLVLMIDDYTSIHTNRRPTQDKSSSSINMCTIVVKAFKNQKAIKLPRNINNLHDPDGINIASCKEVVTSPQSMFNLAHTYSSIMPQWLTRSFFNPELERHRLEEHQYCDDASVRHMRKMHDLNLINFIQLELKSIDGFAAAYNVTLCTGLRQYLKKYAVVQPGDWPCQFYCRQLVYESLPDQVECATDQNAEENPNNLDHGYASCTSSSSSTSHVQRNLPLTPTVLLSPLTSIIPTIGPLHISLNSREHVFVNFRPFFKKLYANLFPRSKLAEKPKPWRINLLLETLYGGWTLIREQAKTTFRYSKDIQYGVLLNLLDNYIPLVLSIYTITFKMNNFKEYFNAMIRVWVMFMCFKRRHYDKAPLVWFSNITHWGLNFAELYNLFREWPTIFDEYPVENIHSILRAQTQSSDTAATLTKKAKSIFESKIRQSNFRSTFTPPKAFSFSIGQLQYLKLKCAKFLTALLKSIHDNPNGSNFVQQRKKKQKKLILPNVFGQESVGPAVLPLGFHSSNKPDCSCRCDFLNCNLENPDEPWTLFEGCWHSFHKKCLDEAISCPVCRDTLKQKVQHLGEIAKQAIFSPKHNKGNDISIDEDEDESEDSENSSCRIQTLMSSEEIDNTVADLNSQISSFPSLTQPNLPNKKHIRDTIVTPPATQCHATGTHNSASQGNSRSMQPPTTASTLPSPTASMPPPPPPPPSPATAPSTSSTTTTPTFTVTRNDFPGVTEWLLPSHICQSQIFGIPVGSNACTIISVLCSSNFLSGTINIPSTLQELVNTIAHFGQNMKTGNNMYDSLNVPSTTPNLEVVDVINCFPTGLKIVQDLGFFSSDYLIDKLQRLSDTGEKKTGVLIASPDKSMSIFMDGHNMAVLDSHQHGLYGAVIATSTNINDFVAYLQLMLTREWNGTLNGCNFAVLEIDH